KLRHALPEWFPLAGPEGRNANVVPVDFIARAMDHIAHMDDDDLYGDTFHLVDPEPKSAGEALNTFAKAAHAPRFAMRVDKQITEIVPKPVRAGLMAVPAIKNIREQMLNDVGIPPDVLEHRDFEADFDARDAQRALRGTGIAVPPLDTYAPKLWDYWERNLDPDLFRERSLKKSVEGKRILVTGASSGIGKTLALKIGEAGGEVILVSRTREKLEEVAQQMEELGGKGHVMPADLSDLDDIERLANDVNEKFGGVDILVNNAGRSIRRSMEASYDRFHDYERTMQLNYFGALKLIMGFMPGMRERRKGHIINVSSIGVQTNTPRFSAYVASKAALDAFSRCIASEIFDDGVYVSTIYMPLVRTPMIQPTRMYDRFPTITPDNAAEMITDAIIHRPKRIATPLGTLGQILYAINPKSIDYILNSAYKLFPDSRAARGEAPRERPEPAPAEEASTEQVLFATLTRGIHW
ncbi:MAG: SDR family oxidoreductase, partial [Solirubrobacterales bacterium]